MADDDWSYVMALSASKTWGSCPCGGQHEQREVEVRMTVEDRVIVLTNVFQGACPSCGSRVYKSEQLARIEDMMKGLPLDSCLARVPIAR